MRGMKMMELRGPFDIDIFVCPNKQSKRAAAGPSRFDVSVTTATIWKTICSQLKNHYRLRCYSISNCWEFLKFSESLFQFITELKAISIPEFLLSLFLLIRNYVKDDQNLVFKILYYASRFFSLLNT